MDHPANYAALLQLAKDHGRGVTTLFALAPANDPFRADHPTSRRQAEWFARVWEETGSGLGTHLRRLHYRLISQAAPLSRLNGKPYENTEECWGELSQFSKAARYLDLAPVGYVIDRRNPAPKLFLEDGSAHELGIDGTSSPLEWAPLQQPGLTVTPPVVAQRYHLEIWCEKSTMDDILVPLGQTFGLNVVTALGEISVTACNDLIGRAVESGRPVRVLYISDFDPAGRSMPVAVARKLEFFIQRDAPDLDVTLQPIVLTHAQCREFQLPRTPIKESERRASAFEGRFGAGATELDALEALYPGELRRITRDEVMRFYDLTLAERVEAAAAETQAALNQVSDAVLAEDGETWDAIMSEWLAMRPQIEALNGRIAAASERAQEAMAAAAGEIEMAWPEPDEGDDYDADEALFDSMRDYREQLAHYHAFQGKGPLPNGED